MIENVTPEGSNAPIFRGNSLTSPTEPPPLPSPEETAIEGAKLTAVAELTAIGISEAAAKIIVGLPATE